VTEELVYVVPRSLALPDGGWHGLRREVGAEEIARLERSGGYRPRPLVEPDPSLKQLIPYLVVRDAGRWFLMRRTRAGGDARLHDRYSIGVGGHVNPEDDGLDGDLTVALEREWHEELIVDFVPAFRFVGLLNDDTTPVGQVHLGLVYEGDAAGRRVAIRETEKLSGAFVPAAEVAAVADSLETWSRIAFEWLEGAPARR